MGTSNAIQESEKCHAHFTAWVNRVAVPILLPSYDLEYNAKMRNLLWSAFLDGWHTGRSNLDPPDKWWLGHEEWFGYEEEDC